MHIFAILFLGFVLMDIAYRVGVTTSEILGACLVAGFVAALYSGPWAY